MIGMWENVKDMSRMFNGCLDFNQAIGNWDVSNVEDMTRMFTRAYDFNQSIGSWNVELLRKWILCSAKAIPLTKT